MKLIFPSKARLAAILGIAFPSGAVAESEIDFNRDIRPILSANCLSCHGPDEESRKADLRLDTAEGIRADLGGYSAFDSKQPSKSEILFRIESDDPDEVMPPPKHGEALSQEDQAKIRKWIESGAEYQTHWAFVRPEKTPLPEIKDASWPASPIDHFVLAKLEAAGLRPAEPADRATLIRRVSLDLTGLPPTPEEADAFINDPSENAYEKVVDRLLASDAYGEHWARMWLDLARYADTKGYEKDRHRDIWRYRDWVIDSLNADMPFDQFTTEQIAGDLLPNATTNQILATAFHRNTMTNDEGGTDNEEFRVAAVKDRVDTTMQVWMGVTMGCAKCHTHKYDPISVTDYYSFYAYFNQTQDADNEAPFHPSPTRDQTEELEILRANLEKAGDDAAKKKAQDAVKKLEAGFPKTPVMQELPENKHRKTQVHLRGNFLSKGDEVSPAVLAVFGEMPQGAPENRLGVAQWLMHPDNPLTARVMANRLWARLFGIGIVESEEDFGSQGLLPSHPLLIDWLAVEFREQDWSMKKLLRTVVLSKTYRQSSAVTPGVLEKDPRNRLLSRGPRFRLSAEMVRDQALKASGLLTHKLGGRSVMPPQPDGIWKSTYNGDKWKNAEGPDRYRRGLYTYLKRTSPYPSMITFDGGSGEVCQIRRVRTNTPLQALVTLNDTVFIEAAGALSKRMTDHPGSLEEKISHGIRLVLIRQPTAAETTRLAKLYESLESDFAADEEARSELLHSAGLQDGDAPMICVANVLLNLDETLTKP